MSDGMSGDAPPAPQDSNDPAGPSDAPAAPGPAPAVAGPVRSAPPPASAPEPAATSATSGPLVAAALMLMAGVLHLYLVEAHMAHARAAGLFFLGLGGAQIVWALLYMRSPSPRLARFALTALVAAPVVIYIITRIWRAPWHPGPEVVDTVGLAVQLLEVASGVALLMPWPDRRTTRRAAAAVGMGLVVGLAGYAGAIAAEDVPWISEAESSHGHASHDDHGGHGAGNVLFAGVRGEPLVGTLAYFGPTTGQALFDLCRGYGDDEQECWLQYLQHYLASAGAVPAYDALVELTRISSAADTNSHPMAHVLGHQAYHAYGRDITLTMKECSYELFQGCIHGALQTYFSDLADQGQPLDAAALGAVCSDTIGSFDAYVCQHGMGHGVMMHTGNDLRASLDMCFLLGNWWARENCYGGVHMENVVGYLDSQRPGFVPHDHGGGPIEYWVDEDDHAYPCNAIKYAYQDSCWRMQTSLVLHFNGRDFRDLSRVCDEEAGDHRLACYNGVGRVAAPEGGRDARQMSRLCSYGADDAQEVCVQAFTAGVILQLNDPYEGAAVCAGLPDHHKGPCYFETGRFANSMLGAEGEALCDGVPEAYQATCHDGRG